MIPVLFSVGELDISSYGASKALAALVAGSRHSRHTPAWPAASGHGRLSASY